MANVTFQMDADEAKAVQGFLKLVDTQRKVESQTKRTNRSLSMQDKAGKKLISTFKTMTTTLVGASALTGAINAYFDSMQKAGRVTVQFSDELTELLGLGSNLQNIGAIRQQVIGFSEDWGIARKEAADAMFLIQSGGGNLSNAIRRDLLQSSIELVKVYGGDLPTSVSGLLKTYQIYGDQVGRVDRVQALLAKSAEDGVLTYGDLATQLPDVAAAAKAMGFELEEVLAALVVATQRGGKTEKTFTGIRNVFLRLSNAEKEGIELNGTLIEQLRQLNEQSDALQRKKIFGDEAFAVISNLTSSVPELLAAFKSLQSDLPDVGDKLKTKLADPLEKAAEQMRRIDQQRTNLDVMDSGLARKALRFKELQLDTEQRLPAPFRFIAPFVSRARFAAEEEPVVNLATPLRVTEGTDFLGAVKNAADPTGFLRNSIDALTAALDRNTEVRELSRAPIVYGNNRE